MNFSIGDKVDSYQIVSELGRGGMGQVFKVEHTLTRRMEAMKVLQGHRPDVPEQAARSLREIEVQAGLAHPNVAGVHNAFWAGQDLILVMELIEGCSLRGLLECGRMPLATAIDYACQALSALSHAHAQGVIHCDVSPSNMMISAKGVLKLTDFGLSKGPTDLQLSRQGAPVGSLYYMSPEQVRGTTPASAASDIYSLGAVLYEMVTGKKPFEDESAFSIMVAQVEKSPVAPIELDPSLPPQLNQAILRALAKAPAERFSSAEEFQQALASIGDPTSGTVTIRPNLRRLQALGAAAALALAIVALAGFAHLPRHHSDGLPATAAVHRPVAAVQNSAVTTNTVTTNTVATNTPPKALAAALPPVRNSPPPVVSKRPARQPVIVAVAHKESGSSPSATSTNFDLLPAAQSEVAGATEPQKPLYVAEEPAAFTHPEPLPEPTQNDPGVASKPGSNGVKNGIHKLWRLVRSK